MKQRSAAFTLVEILVTVAIASALAVGAVAGYGKLITSSRKARSISNLRQLVSANHNYAASHDNFFCPAQDRRNRTRWHGGRSSGRGAFDPSKGFLSPYLGDSKSLQSCPEFISLVRKQKQSGSFEINSGGYGYNASYIGGTVANMYEGANMTDMTDLTRTVMFTTTALAKSDGLQEYPFTEPYESVTRGAVPGTALQPTTHFRFNGQALVAWCDGRVSAESPNSESGPNFYGGDNDTSLIGWFGSREENGYWNPHSPIVSGKD